MIPTPEVAAIQRSVLTRFKADFGARPEPLYDLGVYNCRPIAGTSVPSQHAWANAWDIGVRAVVNPIAGAKAKGDAVVKFLRAEDAAGRLKVGTILWQVRDHYDHVHVEGSPKRLGVPPCMLVGGTMRLGDKGDGVKIFQSALNKAMSLPDIVVDGNYGPATEQAVKDYQHAADLPVTGIIDGITAALLVRYESRS